jgi:pyruvate dehydrogenase E1 component beta subunit
MAMAELTVVEAVNHALALEMDRDERVVVFGEDVGISGGVFRATDGLYGKYGAARVIDTPLAEGVIAGAAIGLALAGWVPVGEIQFLGFAHNGFNQVVDQLARVRYRSAGRFSAQVTIRAPYGGGIRAPELHSDGFEAHFAHAPGLKVVAPATPHDTKGLLLASIRDPDPVLFLEPLRSYRQVRGEVPDGDYEVEIGKARIARPGTDVTLVAWSGAVQVALQAAEDAQGLGISVEVIDLRTLVPLDVATLAESVTRTGRAVILQEAALTAGFGAEVAATIQEEAFFSLQAPIRRVASPDVPYPVQMLEEQYLPNAERVLEAIVAVTQA